MRRSDEGWPYRVAEDDPSWPGRGQHPDWPSPKGKDQSGWPPGGGFPGWPDAEDQPSWPAAEVQPNWPPEGDFPSWPAGGHDTGRQLSEDHPSWAAGDDFPSTPLAPGGPVQPRRRTPNGSHLDRRTSASGSAPSGRARVPESGAPGWTSRHSGPRGGAAASAYAEAVDGGGGAALLTGDPPTGQRPVHGDPVRLAERILSDADLEAAAIKQQALRQAAAIRQAAERETSQVSQQAAQRAGQVHEAEWQAEQIRRQAACQAGQIRDTAAREADELRAGAIRLSAELGQVAEYVTRTLAIPAVQPAALPRRQAPQGYAEPTRPGLPIRRCCPGGRRLPRDTPSHRPAPGGRPPAAASPSTTSPLQECRRPLRRSLTPGQFSPALGQLCRASDSRGGVPGRLDRGQRRTAGPTSQAPGPPIRAVHRAPGPRRQAPRHAPGQAVRTGRLRRRPGTGKCQADSAAPCASLRPAPRRWSRSPSSALSRIPVFTDSGSSSSEKAGKVRRLATLLTPNSWLGRLLRSTMTRHRRAVTLRPQEANKDTANRRPADTASVLAPIRHNGRM